MFHGEVVTEISPWCTPTPTVLQLSHRSCVSASVSAGWNPSYTIQMSTVHNPETIIAFFPFLFDFLTQFYIQSTRLANVNPPPPSPHPHPKETRLTSKTTFFFYPHIQIYVPVNNIVLLSFKSLFRCERTRAHTVWTGLFIAPFIGQELRAKGGGWVIVISDRRPGRLVWRLENQHGWVGIWYTFFFFFFFFLNDRIR